MFNLSVSYLLAYIITGLLAGGSAMFALQQFRGVIKFSNWFVWLTLFGLPIAVMVFNYGAMPSADPFQTDLGNYIILSAVLAFITAFIAAAVLAIVDSQG